MNKYSWIGIKMSLMVIMLSMALLSCKKVFNVEPGNVVDSSDAYQNVNDADAAVIGIYGELMGIAKQYIILNELRGDLMDVTPDADKYLRQISTHAVTQDNPYANPMPFYKVILDCNDALHNFNLMLKNNRMTTTDYNLRYSAVGAVRSWLYLDLGIQYGNVPYVTNPLANLNDLKNENNFPRLTLDQLLDSLIQFTESLPDKDPFPAGASLLTTIDGYSTQKFFVPIHCLLGDLYLWKGNYMQAAINYHYVMTYSERNWTNADEQYYEVYKLAYTANINGADWVNIFSQPYGERYSNYEIIWDLPFDQSYKPVNPFINLFDNTNGSYLLKPSQLAMNNWNSQTRTDGTPGDYRGENASWKLVNGQPVINKFISNYNPLLPFNTDGKWILYRAAELNLRYAEAANRYGKSKLAYALLNWGLKFTFDPEHLNTAHDSRDVGDIEQSFDPPFDFDARQGDYPRYRGPWCRNVGIRGRVSLPLIVIDSAKYFDMNANPRTFLNSASEDSIEVLMENKLIDADGLELAFEGHRWPDLLRIALRREKEQAGSGVAFLQNKIAAKFIAAGNPGEAASVSAKLANPNNWFLPFNWK